ncbi:MAG: hypothetical protein AB7P03_00495 [Kofleriaceae bacterium]
MATDNKTSTPKTDATSSTSFPFPGPGVTSFDPIAVWSATQQAFTKMVNDAYGRAQSFADQYASLEHQMVERAKLAIANWSQFCQDAINYGANLSAEARKIGFETAKKMGINN